MGGIWLAFLHVIGADSSTTRWYYFWSAFGSGPVAWCALPLVYWLHHLCHENRCYRLGHPDNDGIVKCRRHVERRAKVRRLNR